jgi:thiol-disulfide isomerase/thioredoxin
MTATELPPEDRAPVRPPRRVSRGLLAAAVLATVVLAIATVMAFRTSGEPAPERLSLDDLSESPYAPTDLEGNTDLEGAALPGLTYTTFDGAERTLTTGGRPLILNFWAANCGPCIDEMPALDEVYREVSPRIGMLGLQTAEGAQRGLDMVEATGVTYPVARDLSGDVLITFAGGFTLPTTVFIAADGTIADIHLGAMSADELRSLIDEHLVGP